MLNHLLDSFHQEEQQIRLFGQYDRAAGSWGQNFRLYVGHLDTTTETHQSPSTRSNQYTVNILGAVVYCRNKIINCVDIRFKLHNPIRLFSLLYLQGASSYILRTCDINRLLFTPDDRDGRLHANGSARAHHLQYPYFRLNIPSHSGNCAGRSRSICAPFCGPSFIA